MLADPEHFKGLVYVRISSLPLEQKNKIRENYSREKIIKILKGNSLISDCILYDDYVKWFKKEDTISASNLKNEAPSEPHFAKVSI